MEEAVLSAGRSRDGMFLQKNTKCYYTNCKNRVKIQVIIKKCIKSTEML